MDDEARAVEEAVRAYFHAPLGEREGLATGAAGRRAQLAATVGPVTLGTGERTTDIRRLEVVRVDADEAEVDLDAVERTTVVYALSARTGAAERSFAGPLLARRVGGSWRVADYRIDGVPLEELLVEPPGEVEVERIRVAVRAISLEPRATRCYVELENLRESAVLLSEAWRGARSAGVVWRYLPVPLARRRELPRGERVVVLVGWRERHRGDLRLVFRGGETDGPSGVDFTVHVPRDGAPIRAVKRLPLEVRLGLRRQVWIQFVPLIAFCLLAWLGHEWIAAAVLAADAVALMGAAVGAWRRRRATPRQLASFAVAPITLLLLAVFVLQFGGSRSASGCSGEPPREISDGFANNLAFFGPGDADGFVSSASRLLRDDGLENLRVQLGGEAAFAAPPHGSAVPCSRGARCFRYRLANGGALRTTVTCGGGVWRVQRAAVRR